MHRGLELTGLEFVDIFKVFERFRNGFVSADELRHMKTNLSEKFADQDVDVMIRETDVDDVGQVAVYEQSAHVRCTRTSVSRYVTLFS